MSDCEDFSNTSCIEKRNKGIFSSSLFFKTKARELESEFWRPPPPAKQEPKGRFVKISSCGIIALGTGVKVMLSTYQLVGEKSSGVI